MSAVEVVLATEQPRTLRLERELGDGAEAIVYEAEPDLAVKLFHSPSVEVARRLESMMALARADDLHRRAAKARLAAEAEAADAAAEGWFKRTIARRRSG